jgi:tryptophan aminotransferase
MDETTYTLTQDELALGLQYSDTAGILPLRKWLYGLQEVSHGRKTGEGWSVCVGGGSQDLIYKVCALTNQSSSLFFSVN